MIAAVTAFKFYPPFRQSELFATVIAKTTGRELPPPISSGESSPILYAVLDLNGDGIGNVPMKAPWIHFDHTGNGVRTATTWITPQDAFLGVDSNNNGLLDNGTELIGNHFKFGTITKAENSFNALAAIDSNQDGIIDQRDAVYPKLLVWQDQNQDAICQPTETQSLEKAGITSIKTNLVVQRALGTFVTGSGDFEMKISAADTVSKKEFLDFNFEVNTFYRKFSKEISITEEANNLPDMSGSGLVRDMNEAASLSPAFAKKLTEYANTKTRDRQFQLLESLAIEWGNTSGLADMKTRATQNGYDLTVELPPNTFSMITTLEQFNGRGFFAMPWEEHIGPSARQGLIVGWDGNPKHVKVKLYPPQLQQLLGAYKSLKDSIYQAMLSQTRLKPYYDAIRTSPYQGTFTYDFDLVKETFKNNFERDSEATIIDLVEFNKTTSDDREMRHWATMGSDLLDRLLMEITPTSELKKFLAEFSITTPESTGLVLARTKVTYLPASENVENIKPKSTGSYQSRDMRHCLSMDDNMKIVRCSEQNNPNEQNK